MSGPPPKRQRLPGSYSPASPPYHLAAKGAIGSAKPAIVQPQTPVSPSNMSSGPGTSSSTSPTHTSNLSPPLSGSASTHPSTQTSVTTALLTPASSVKGSSTSTNDDDVLMTDVTSHPSAAQGASTDDSASHIRTDHDRENENDAEMEDLQQLPERLDAHSEPFLYVLEDSHPPSAPHPSRDLIAMYDLKSIAASVARRDPDTGEKINKIRKSYEGKIKTLGISGRNKPTSKSGELSGLLQVPEDAWQATEVSTRDVKKGITASLESRLDRALKMNPGKLPPDEADKWKSMLAVDEPVKAKAGVDSRKIGAQPPTSNAKATSSSAAHAEPLRPQRAGRKRRYDDSSFEGYAEGVHDEEGYSSPEERLATVAAKKRRRKVRTEEGPAVVGGSGGSETYKKKNLGLKLRLAEP